MVLNMLGMMVHYVIIVMLRQCGKKSALWVEIRIRSAAQASLCGSNNHLLFNLWSAEILHLVMLNFYHFFQ